MGWLANKVYYNRQSELEWNSSSLQAIVLPHIVKFTIKVNREALRKTK